MAFPWTRLEQMILKRIERDPKQAEAIFFPEGPPGIRDPSYQTGSGLLPPPLPLDPTPMHTMGAYGRQEDRQRMGGQGAMALDVPGSERLTEEEIRSMRDAHNAQGRTFRYEQPVSVPGSEIPEGTLFP